MTQAGRKPFKTRLIASIFLWLLIGFVLAFTGFIIWLMPGRSEYELRGAVLPGLSELTLVEGKIVGFSYTSDSRRGTFSIPKIEFHANNQTFHLRTIDSYGHDTFPFQQGQAVEVLYLRGQPQKAWLKWEYDRLMDNYQGLGRGLIIEKIQRVYGYLALGVLAVTGLFFLLNLFFPILGRFKSP